MAATETVSENSECPVLEMPMQDFFEEAKALIAQHNDQMNKNKVRGTSINVFKNKHQKPKAVVFLPLKPEIKKTTEVLQELQTTHKAICSSRDLSKIEQPEERSQPTLKVPRICVIKEKCEPHVDIKEPVNLSELVTEIKALSEVKPHHEKLRTLDTFPSIKLDLPFRSTTSSFMWNLRTSVERIYDWRGVVSVEPSDSTPVSEQISFSDASSKFADYSAKIFRKRKLSAKPEQKPQQRTKSVLGKTDKSSNKVSRIGPHIVIFQVFQKHLKLRANKKAVRMITTLQAYVRGWLERKRLQRLKDKACYHGPNLRTVINMYRSLIHRVKYRLSLSRTRTIIKFSELEEWMDRKKFYETMFKKRQDWQGIERSELMKYFNDCGHFPVQKQIDDIWNLVHTEYREKCSDLVTKANAIEMLFTLYPPQGAHVSDHTQLRSTWLRPIVDGEEGYKYIVSGHPVLKKADIRIVGNLVAKSIRERKLRNRYLLKDQE